jgi:DNA-binding FadR family transcriptional regulator
MIRGKRVSMQAAIRHRTIHQQVVDHLGQRIVDGEYAVGEQLPNEERLSEQLQVSRGVVREAVRVLVAKRLLSSRPRLGTVVLDRHLWNLLDPDVLRWSSRDHAFLADLFALRLILEPAACRLAAECATDEDKAQLQAAYDSMVDAAATVAVDNAAFVAADVQFHTGVLRSTLNQLVSHLAGLLEAGLSHGMETTSHAPGAVAHSLPLHREVLDGILTGDGDRAEAAMRALISEASALGAP